MNTKAQAEKMARDCAIALNPKYFSWEGNVDLGVRSVLNAIPLVELLEVAKTASEIVDAAPNNQRLAEALAALVAKVVEI